MLPQVTTLIDRELLQLSDLRLEDWVEITNPTSVVSAAATTDKRIACTFLAGGKQSGGRRERGADASRADTAEC